MSGSELCIFGEVLFDIFPDGQRVLGGAPFNVAWHAQAFGLSPYFVSRVGSDEPGDQVIAAMRNWGMQLGGLQQDAAHPTGRVQVSLGPGNEPAYDIVADCAYDFIDGAALSEARTTCRLLYHGSLALRNAVSRGAMEALRGAGGETFVDVNLRPPWWDAAAVSGDLRGARGVKLNEHELAVLVPDAATMDERINRFIETYTPGLLIVTLGEAGALAVTADGETASVAPQRSHSVVDTVGAGDAFTSVVLLGVLQSWPLAQILERAQSFASAIVGVRGATVSDMDFYRSFIRDWGLG
ncbi:MAG: carbohydrate kinase [Gammaproteobacteria bacterium]|jgi:fructokinase